jgi:tyrosinase
MTSAVRIRRDVWKLQAEHTGDDWPPTLLWYARAVASLQSRPISNPTSWRYQAAIHDYDPSSDPLGNDGEPLPGPGDQERFWAQCQHGSWYFLPWHRMYLLFFEQIVADAIVQLNGPADWALPYWDYSDRRNPRARRLPPAFRAERTLDGADNPLRVDARRPGANAGDEIAAERHVDVAGCLREPLFVGPTGGTISGFGGPETAFSHGGGTIGQLEATPHGSMHVRVGGPAGWMSAFNTAALDPIFWLHHANIDRLWAAWLARDSQHLNPPAAKWLTGQSFEFHRASGGGVALTPAQVVDTAAAPLNYRYEDVSDPLPAVPAERAARARRRGVEEQAIPEMVGATEEPISLVGRPATARMAIREPSGPARAARRSGGPAPRIYLNVENIIGSGGPTSYAVYLNVPPGDDPARHPDLYAGLLPMFGLREASRVDRGHSGSGLHYSLDVTSVVRTLEGRQAWDPGDLRVTFVPDDEPAASVRARAAPVTPIRVGRVSLYYA